MRVLLCRQLINRAAEKIKQASDSGCAVQRAGDNQESATGLAAESKSGKRMESRHEMRHWVPKPTCTTEITNKTKINLGGYVKVG
jgi:hypothetical protein